MVGRPPRDMGHVGINILGNGQFESPWPCLKVAGRARGPAAIGAWTLWMAFSLLELCAHTGFPTKIGRATREWPRLSRVADCNLAGLHHLSRRGATLSRNDLIVRSGTGSHCGSRPRQVTGASNRRLPLVTEPRRMFAAKSTPTAPNRSEACPSAPSTVRGTTSCRSIRPGTSTKPPSGSTKANCKVDTIVRKGEFVCCIGGRCLSHTTPCRRP